MKLLLAILLLTFFQTYGVNETIEQRFTKGISINVSTNASGETLCTVTEQSNKDTIDVNISLSIALYVLLNTEAAKLGMSLNELINEKLNA